MKQYLNLLNDILINGSWKEPSRKNMPRTKEVYGRMLKFDLQEGFPLLTTKKMYFKGIVGELLWFLKGDTNIKYLVDNNINIWNDDAYKYYKFLGGVLDKDKWINKIKDNSELFIDKNIETNYEELKSCDYNSYGDCGNIYGYQWCKKYDNQIYSLIENIKRYPNSRYHVVTAWSPSDFLQDPTKSALPACHMIFQCNVRDNKYLDLSILQRSSDTFLGLPFNIASYALLTYIIAKSCDLEVGELTWFGNSVHLYENHMDAVNEQIKREPLKLCKLKDFDKKFFNEYEISDFQLIDYKSHEKIKAPLSVGL